MLILREGTKGNFVYTSSGGKITDNATLEYIKNLVIPPMYRNVNIFYEGPTKTPKILYTGVDSKGRLQRIYSKEWRSKKDREKFCDLLIFGEKVSEIIRDTEYLLDGPLSKEKMIAMIIRLVMLCHFRIGNSKYKELYGSFGAINIQKRHISVKQNTIKIKFKGKKGVVNQCTISDSKFIREMKRLIANKEPKQTVFQYMDNGNLTDISAVDFNKYLNQYDKRMTSRMFRLWDSNILFIMYMAQAGDPSLMSITERKRKLVQAYKFVSDKINNTPAILKKSYTQSGLNDLYLNSPAKYNKLFMGEAKKCWMDYLRSIC